MYETLIQGYNIFKYVYSSLGRMVQVQGFSSSLTTSVSSSTVDQSSGISCMYSVLTVSRQEGLVAILDHHMAQNINYGQRDL